MFENILFQNNVIDQLKSDIENGSLAPSVLFSGPEYSGKGTAALELARILSCENEVMKGNWNCSCSSCAHHRNLVSPDLLLLGRRRFFEEIAASSGTILRNPDNSGSRMLFLRSVRKLLLRFNSVLWEDDPKLGKLKGQIEILEEELEDIGTAGDNADFKKKCENIIKKAVKLQTDGLGELIPIAQIRRAAYWSRLAPLGRHKCIILENAENMQEGAKNSLLKILEEPPPYLSIVLTSSRPMVLVPTMLSRLREYRFAKRKADAEKEVLSRIFREMQPAAASIESYLASFLPVKSEMLYSLGAFFAASVAAEAVREGRARGWVYSTGQTEGNAANECPRSSFLNTPAVLIDLGKFTAHIAEAGAMGRPADDVKEALQKVLGAAEQFDIPGLFTRFLQQCSAIISSWLRSGDANQDISLEKSIVAELWHRELNQSMVENDSFNIGPPMVLERLFEALKTGMI